MIDLQEYAAPGAVRAQEAASSGCTQGRYVNPSCGLVYITLPGADRSYAVTPIEAYKLFRELEALV